MKKKIKLLEQIAKILSPGMLLDQYAEDGNGQLFREDDYYFLKPEYRYKLASQISALFNTEEIREKIARTIWDSETEGVYPDWKDIPPIAKKFYLEVADKILSLLFDQKQEKEPCPDKNFRKCYEPHLRNYPDCFEECGCDVCEAPIFGTGYKKE